LQRREAFKASMKKLIELTQRGTIWEAGQWDITRALFGKKETNAMHDLGVFVAKQVLGYEKEQSKAAAILLLICLDFAYNAVVSVSCDNIWLIIMCDTLTIASSLLLWMAT
jgi:hypothetical protein